MKKLIVVFTGLISACLGQTNFVLKAPLTTADSLFIVKEIRSQVFPGPTMRLEYTPSDFEAPIPGKDKAFNETRIEELKEKLSGADTDAYVYFELMEGYNSLFLNLEARDYLDKSMKAGYRLLDENPDDAKAHLLIARIALLKQVKEEAEYHLKKILKKNPHHPEAKSLYTSMPFYSFDGKEAMKRMLANIEAYPDSSRNYRLLPLYYLMKVYGIGDSTDERATEILRFKGKTIDELTDLGLITKALERNKKDEAFEVIYKLSQLCVLMAKSARLTSADSVRTENYPFIIEKQDEQILKKLASFFEKKANDESNENRYLYLKTVANIYVFLNNQEKAQKYWEKCLTARLNQKSDLFSNAANAYDALAATRFMQGDTAGMLKFFLDKISKPESVNPNVQDYVRICKYYLFRNDLIKGKEYLDMALSRYSKAADINLCNGVYCILNRESIKAQNYFEADLKVSEDPFELHVIIGLYSLLTGHADNAYDWFTEAKKGARRKQEIQKKYMDRFLVETKK